ncbi:MAG: hypothetical protein ACUVV6_06790 [Thermoplasmatota archaeon]
MSDEVPQVAAQPGQPQTPFGTPQPTGGARGLSGFSRLMKNRLLLIGLLAGIAAAVVAAVALSGIGGSLMGEKPRTPPPLRLESKSGAPIAIQGELVPEGQTVEQALEFTGGNSTNVTNIYEVTVRCQWTDGMPESRPDTMVFMLSSPNGQNVTQTTDGMSGQATLTIKVSNMTDRELLDNTKGWKLSVTCEAAGDDPIGPIGFFVWVDPGNDWSATVDYKYYGLAQ